MAVERRLSNEEEPDRLCALLPQNELEISRAEICSFFSTYKFTILPKYVQDSTDIASSESQKTQLSADEGEMGSAGDNTLVTYLADLVFLDSQI